MTAPDNDAEAFPSNYFGTILHANGSDLLHDRLMNWIQRYQEFDTLGGPIIPYISAWRDGDPDIWYEFVGKGFLELLDCPAPDAARIFRSCILEYQVYSRPVTDNAVRKRVLDSKTLDEFRSDIRRESLQTGLTEAIYKLRVPSGKLVWYKDHARIDVFPADHLNMARGYLTPITKEMEMAETCDRLVSRLQSALSQIKTLRGMLPICASCKKIRDDRGYWRQIEEYLTTHADVAFSHGICPECARRLYPEYMPHPDLTIHLTEPAPNIGDPAETD